MTTNINKIVRSNLTLKPWILSKNTSEIVNTCIEKIYKQVPNNFRQDLIQTKMASPRPENKGPIRAFRSQEIKDRARQSNLSQPSKYRFRAPLTTGEQLLTAVMKSSKKGSAQNFAAAKKLLKSPNYKIYGSRRFGSSASSSSASIFHRYDKQRRNRLQQTAQLNYLLRSFGSLSGRNHLGLNPSAAKILVPERNQHMQNTLGSIPQALEVSSNIQRDLMAIDNSLKNRISLAKNRVAKLGTVQKDVSKESNEPKDALRGWHHPNAAELFMTRLNEGTLATSHLHEQHRKLSSTQASRQQGDVKSQNFIFGAVGKKLSRISENLNAILGEVKPRNNPHHPIMPKQDAPVERMPPLRRFSLRRTVFDSRHPHTVSPNQTTATATSRIVAEVDASLQSVAARNGRYNRSLHYNRRY